MRNTFRKNLMRAIAMVGILFMGLSMASCSNDKEEFIDGKWDPMEWTTDVEINPQGKIDVSIAGGTYVFKCTNYAHVWISEVCQKSADGTMEFYPVNGDINNVESPWGKVSIVGNEVIVGITSNQSFEKREYIVVVTAGDTFHCFNFNQRENFMVGF